MKKFKFKKSHSKLISIIIIVLLLVIFIIISFLNINKSHQKLVNILVNNFTKENNLSISLLTSNLDNLIKTSSFMEKKIIYQKPSKLYLYNTHDLEKYNDGTTIIEVSNLLKNNLSKLGIESIIEKRRPSELLATGLSYYEISRLFLKDAMNKEKNISYYIDIHRDSVNDTKIVINDKPYAKLMFVLGLENKNYAKNKEIITKMNNYLNDKYPGISKGIYEKKGAMVDGLYNQDLDENIILLEIGGMENTKEEINNSTEVISLMLYHIIGEKNEKRF